MGEGGIEKAVSLYNEMKGSGGRFSDAPRLSEVAKSVLERLKECAAADSPVGLPLAKVGLLQEGIVPLVDRMLADAAQHVAGLSDEQATVLAELAGQGRTCVPVCVCALHETCARTFSSTIARTHTHTHTHSLPTVCGWLLA